MQSQVKSLWFHLLKFPFMKKNLHYPWMLLCACAVSLTAAATPVTPDQALQRAIGQASSSKMKKKPAKGTARLAHTFRATTEQEPTLYVFNKGTGDGYMITPADDRFPALLGYGDNGDFNIDEISPAMKASSRIIHAKSIMRSKTRQKIPAPPPSHLRDGNL